MLSIVVCKNAKHSQANFAEQINKIFLVSLRFTSLQCFGSLTKTHGGRTIFKNAVPVKVPGVRKRSSEKFLGTLSILICQNAKYLLENFVKLSILDCENA